MGRLTDELRASGRRPVWFNAWHHQGEENLFAALLEAVRQDAVPPWFSLAGADVRTRLFLGRLRSNPVRTGLALAAAAALLGFGFAIEWPSFGDILRAFRALTEQQKDSKETAPVWTLLGGLAAPFGLTLGALLFFAGFRDRLKSAGLDPGKLMAAARKSVRWKDLGAQLGFRARFDAALQEVMAALGRRTLTILIDDLDRCQPAQIAQVLESMNYLAASGGCFMVLAIAKEQVLAGIGLANKEIATELRPDLDERTARDAYARDFLRKLIQIEVPVPRFNAAAVERLLGAATAEPPVGPADRVWLAPVMALLLCGCLFLAGTAGHSLYAPLVDAWQRAAPIAAHRVRGRPGTGGSHYGGRDVRQCTCSIASPADLGFRGARSRGAITSMVAAARSRIRRRSGRNIAACAQTVRNGGG